MKKVLIFMCLILAGCKNTRPGIVDSNTFLPPPPAVESPASLPAGFSTRASAPTPHAATSTPACTNNLTFQEDLTLPDGTIVTPRQPLDKRWRVENTGSCNWDEQYRLRLVEGSELGALPDQALYPARSGTQAVIRLMFTAPAEVGKYRSAWQAYDPQGNLFGDPIFIEIVVASSASP